MDEVQRNDDVFDAQLPAMVCCKRQFLAVVVATVVETQRYGDRIGVIVEHGYGIHATGQYDDAVFHETVDLLHFQDCGTLFAQALFPELLMVGVSIVGKRIDADASTRREQACYLDILRIYETDEVFHDDIHAILMEIAMVAEREQVELERLALDHLFARNIRDDDSRVIGLAGQRAQSGELRAMEGNEILVIRMFVDKRFQNLRRIRCGDSSTLVAEQAHSL